jgi:hypothetical protein
MRAVILTMLIFTAIGCYAESDVGYRVAYASPPPSLVYVSPGVQVVADFDYPVFLTDGLYWRYDGGVWYRSRTYTGGWSVTTSVPVAVRRIDRPSRYVHYHATAVARTGGGRAVRDHRASPASPARASRGRDHRQP